MSTKNYAMVELALVLSQDEITEYFADFMEKKGIDNPYDAAFALDICYESEFTGELMDPVEHQYGSPLNATYNSDPIFYLPSRKMIIDPFRQAYRDMDEVVDEFKAHPLAKYFPEDFDYTDHICIIVGTYYG